MDSYNSNQSKYEKVVFNTPPHIIFLILPLLVLLFFAFLYKIVLCPVLITPIFDGECPLVSALIFLFLIVVVFLDWGNNRLILTKVRVVRKRGIIGKSITTIRLERVQDIKVSFGITGRIFGFGTIVIESAGTYGKIVFKRISYPREVKERIEKEIPKVGRDNLEVT